MEGIRDSRKQEAHLLASLSEGSPGKALEIRGGNSSVPREELLKDLGGIEIALHLKRWRFWSESLPSQREELLLMLEVPKTLLRDLVIVKAVKENPKLIHSDLSQKIEDPWQ